MYPGASDMYGDEEAIGVGSSPRPESVFCREAEDGEYLFYCVEETPHLLFFIFSGDETSPDFWWPSAKRNEKYFCYAKGPGFGPHVSYGMVDAPTPHEGGTYLVVARENNLIIMEEK